MFLWNGVVRNTQLLTDYSIKHDNKHYNIETNPHCSLSTLFYTLYFDVILR